MPEEHPAIIERVPVGAMVVTVALRTLALPSKTLPWWLGNTPRSFASAIEAALPSVCTKLMVRSASSTASWEL